MEIFAKEGWGILAVSAKLNINDQIILCQVLDNLDRFDDFVEKIDAWDKEAECHTLQERNEETGCWEPTQWAKDNPRPGDPMEEAHKMGFDPMEEQRKLRKFCRKLCHVKLGESNIFDDEVQEAKVEKVAK